MSPKIQFMEVKDFSGGLNTRQDSRVIQSNESPLMLNVDITAEGSVVTRYGFEKVATIGATGTKLIGLYPYNKVGTFNRLMCWNDDGNLYYITDTNFAPVTVGAYTTLTNTGIFDAMQLQDKLVFGNGTANPKQYDGISITATTDTYPTLFFETWEYTGSVTGANGFAGGNPSAVSTFYVSKTGDITTWSGSGSTFQAIHVGDGDKLTALKHLEETMFIFKRDRTFMGKGFINPSDGKFSLQLSPSVIDGGCVAHDSIQIMFNDIIRLADPMTYGVCTLGLQNSIFSQNQRNNSLSWKIAPSIRQINSTYMENATSAYFQDKYFLSVPMGQSAINDETFVYSQTIDGRGYWTNYQGFYPQVYKIFEINNKKELLFASAVNNNIYKMNNQFNDDGQGYKRIFRTKTFDFGYRVHNKNFKRFYIRGAITPNTILKLRVFVDGITEEYEINSDYLEYLPSGGIMGDNIYGDELLGGDEVDQLYRFMYRDDFTLNINNGREVYFEFENDGIGQGWKIDYIGVEYSVSDIEENYPLTLTSN